ncbi:hypothetical protein KY334_00070 [Candidatus Woesearchaeota archaeon]|nr:hypothetical protein [Candidatus Woesearchaeota archaeon]
MLKTKCKESLYDVIGEKVCPGKTPFFNLKKEPLKTISFDWDRGGWNNVRMGVETMLCIAKIFNRALVLPEPRRWYLLNEKAHLFDFYDEASFKSFVPVYIKPKEGAVKDFSDEIVTNSQGKVNVKLLKKYKNYDHWHFPMRTRMFSYFPLGFPRPGRFFSLIKSSLRIKNSLIDEACKRLEENNLELVKYVALHVRKNDFQYKSKNISAEDIVNKVTKSIEKNIPILILSDVYNEELISLFEDKGHRVVCWSQKGKDSLCFKNHPSTGKIYRTESKESIVIDMLCGVPAKRFFGSFSSSFSSYIPHMRGLLSNIYPEIDTSILYTGPGNKNNPTWWSYVDENYWEKNRLKKFRNYLNRKIMEIDKIKFRKKCEKRRAKRIKAEKEKLTKDLK